MEIENLILALEETIFYLKSSQSSDWGTLSSEDVIRRLESEAVKAKNLKPVDVDLLERLFAPTGVIQEISIENGWGTKFLRMAQVIDEFIAGK